MAPRHSPRRSSTVGDYLITASGAASSNYSIAYGSGHLTIGKATPAITIASASGQYSDSLNLTSLLVPASLAGRTATGTVTFFIGGIAAGSSAVDGARAKEPKRVVESSDLRALGAQGRSSGR